MSDPRGDGTDPADGRKADLRYTIRDDWQTRIERNLDGSGRLARGDHTNMHSLRFTARAVPRPREKQAPEEARREPVPPADERVPPPPTDASGIAQKLMGWMFPRPLR